MTDPSKAIQLVRGLTGRVGAPSARTSATDGGRSEKVLFAEWLRPPAKVWRYFALVQVAIAAFLLLTAWGAWRVGSITAGIGVLVTTLVGLLVMFDQSQRRWWVTGQALFTGFPDSSRLPVRSVPLTHIRSVETVETGRIATIENAVKSAKTLGCAKVWCNRNVAVYLEGPVGAGRAYLSTHRAEEAADILADAVAAAKRKDST